MVLTEASLEQRRCHTISHMKKVSFRYCRAAEGPLNFLVRDCHLIGCLPIRFHAGNPGYPLSDECRNG